MNFSSHTLQTILSSWGYVAVLGFVAIESSGIPFPGETMLVAAAVYAGTGHLNIVLVIVAGAAGAILGDNLGYAVGRTGGRALVERYGKYIRVDTSKLATAERFFAKHGDKTVFFGRFVAVLRAWAAFLAGLNRMHWIKFGAFNAAGGIVWATLYGVLGFELGKNLPLLHKIEQTLGVAGVVAAVIVVAAAFILHRRHRGRNAPGDAEGTVAAAAESPASHPIEEVG